MLFLMHNNNAIVDYNITISTGASEQFLLFHFYLRCERFFWCVFAVVCSIGGGTTMARIFMSE